MRHRRPRSRFRGGSRRAVRAIRRLAHPLHCVQRVGVVRRNRRALRARARARDKGLVNITAIGPSGRGEKAGVRGRFRNLLDQTTKLDFREIDDNGSVYYLARFDFENGENLRFEVNVDLPEHGVETLRFQQPLYFADR